MMRALKIGANVALYGAAWMTLAQALFAVMSVSARLGGHDVPWQEVAATRFIIGALTAFVAGTLQRKSLRVKRQREAYLRSVFGTMAACGTFYTLAAPGIAIGDAVTLFATSPIFVALLSWPLLGERVRRSVVVAMGLAFVGIVAVARPSFGTAGHVVLAGAFTAVSSALAMIWLRRIGPDESSEAIVFHFSCFGSVVCVLLSIPVWRTPDATSAMYLAMTGLSGGLAQLAMTRAYAFDSAARISAFGYSGIVFTRLFALPVFGEQPTLVQVAGSLLVIGAGLVLALRGVSAPRPLA
jgi:drug/metabolite transporter (DMT)-like permease